MRRRDRPAQPRLSEALRRRTEQRWTDDPSLNDVDGGLGCDDCGPHIDHYHHSDFADHNVGDADDGEEWV